MTTCPRCGKEVHTPYYRYPDIEGLCDRCVHQTRMPPAELFPIDPHAHNGAGCYDTDTDFSQ